MKNLTGIGHEVFIELAGAELSHKLTQVLGEFLLHLLLLSGDDMSLPDCLRCTIWCFFSNDCTHLAAIFVDNSSSPFFLICNATLPSRSCADSANTVRATVSSHLGGELHSKPLESTKIRKDLRVKCLYPGVGLPSSTCSRFYAHTLQTRCLHGTRHSRIDGLRRCTRRGSWPTDLPSASLFSCRVGKMWGTA
jgi:hypothetical protein